jgi:hypothetical protein
MKKFILIEYDDGRNVYIQLSDIKSIRTVTKKSPVDENGQNPPCPYRASVTFVIHNGMEIAAEIWLDTNRRVNIKHLLKKWAIRL